LIFEYINRMLKDFNRSNVLNFQVTQDFIKIDFGLLEATDVIIEMSQYIQLNRSNSPFATLPNKSYTHSKLPLGIEDFLQSKLAAAIRRYNSAIDSVHMNNLLYVDPHNLVHEMEIITEVMKYSYSSRHSGQKLIDTSIGGWTFYLYLDELILSQRASVMKFYNDASGLEPVELSAGKNDLTLTVLSDYLERMEKYFEDISNILVIADVDEHLKEINPLLIYTGIVAGLLFIFLLFILRSSSTKMQLILSNYSILRPWELHMIQEDILIEIDSFSTNYFNELHLINKHLEFNTVGFITDSMNRSLKHQNKISRTKLTFKLKHDFFFKSLWRMTWVAFLSLMVYGMTLITVFSFLAVNEHRFGMQHLCFDTYKSLVSVTTDYFASTLLTTSGLYYPVANTPIADNAFARAVDNFIVYITGKKRDYDFYYGEELGNIADSLFFDDLCAFLPRYSSHYLPDTDVSLQEVCEEILGGALRKGIVGVMQHQKSYFESLRGKMAAEYATELEASKTAKPGSEVFGKEYFSQEFVDLRVSRWLCNKLFFEHFLRISETRTRIIRDDMNYYVAGWVYVISLILGVVLVFLYIWVAASQKTDLDVCYELFWLIGPMFLTNNKLLQTQLKSSYHGIG
jgi:hypothetical protein